MVTTYDQLHATAAVTPMAAKRLFRHLLACCVLGLCLLLVGWLHIYPFFFLNPLFFFLKYKKCSRNFFAQQDCTSTV